MSAPLDASPAPGVHRLIYFSREIIRDRNDVDHEIDRIIRVAIANNRQLNVTGLLLIHQQWFVQVLEGRYETVQTLYGKISRDPRHEGATVISAGPAPAREFGDWNMCARRTSDTDAAIIDVLDQRGAFDPARLSGPAALNLLRTVARVQRGHELASEVARGAA